MEPIDNYRFYSDSEPSEEMLTQLMREVAQTAREKAETAKQQLMNEILSLTEQLKSTGRGVQ